MMSRIKKAASAFMFSALALSGAFLLCDVHAVSVSAEDQGNDGPPIVKQFAAWLIESGHPAELHRRMMAKSPFWGAH